MNSFRYRGSANHFVVPNLKEWAFSEKVEAAVNCVCQVVGLPALHAKRWFSIDFDSLGPLPVDAEHFLVEYIYIYGGGGSDSEGKLSLDRVQKRTHIRAVHGLEEAFGCDVVACDQDYSLRKKTEGEEGKDITSFRRINGREYALLRERQLPKSKVLRRWRRVFADKNLVFELDVMPIKSGKPVVKLTVTYCFFHFKLSGFQLSLRLFSNRICTMFSSMHRKKHHTGMHDSRMQYYLGGRSWKLWWRY